MHFICAKVMIILELFVILQKNIAFYERTGAKVGYQSVRHGRAE